MVVIPLTLLTPFTLDEISVPWDSGLNVFRM
jgi:hypothetical protein